MEWLIYLTNKINCFTIVVIQFFSQPLPVIPSTNHLNRSNSKDNKEVIQSPCKDVECLIMQMEGFSAKPVYCGGYAIGYGRAVSGKNIQHYRNNPITRAEALIMLKEDLNKKRNQVDQLFRSRNIILNPNQIDALASIAYNTGFYSFKKKALVNKINLKEESGVSITEEDFINTITPSNRKKYRGLIKRRKAEYRLYMSNF